MALQSGLGGAGASGLGAGAGGKPALNVHME